MSGFSIDDVAGTFAVDMSALMIRIDGAARPLTELPVISATNEHGADLFGAIADCGHSIKGTSRLIGAVSLAEGGEVLEELAREGRIALDAVEQSLQRVRGIAAACLAGRRVMESMVELELSHDGDVALEIGREWRVRAREIMSSSGVPGPARPLADAQFNFDDERQHPAPVEELTVVARPVQEELRGQARGPSGLDAVYDTLKAAPEAETASPPPVAQAAIDIQFDFDVDESQETESIDEELLAVFRQEAEELARPVHDDLLKLKDDPQDRAAAARLDIAYHTLKGAAAAIGLTRVAETFKKLEQVMALAAEGAQRITLDRWRSIVEATRLSYQQASVALEVIDLSETAARPDSGFAFIPDGDSEALEAELLDVFRNEVSELAVAMRKNLHLLQDDPRDMSTCAQLERVYHTLKGAAATIGRTAIAEGATALQTNMEHVVEAGLPLSAQQVTAIIAESDRLLALAGLGPVGDRAPSADSGVEQVFSAEARELLGRAEDLIPQLGSSPNAAVVALAQIFHRLAGSASMHKHAGVSAEASRLEQACLSGAVSAADVIAGLKGISIALNVGESEAPSNAGPSLATTRDPVQLVAEGALFDAFQQECADLIESLDRCILRLPDSANPRVELDEVSRLVHTLKGSVNTVGLAPTGRLLHRIEDLMDILQERPILPAMRTLASVLLAMQDEIRAHLRDAPSGYVMSHHQRFEREIEKLLGTGTGKVAGAIGAVGTAVPQRRDRARDSEEDSSQRSSQRAPEVAERKTLRIASERLDDLMNIAGELVLSRSRLITRVGSIKAIEGGLRGSRSRLLGAVDGFRDRYEFSSINTAKVFQIDQRTSSRPMLATAPTTSERPANGSEGFSDLELDRYEDVNILARTLSEITSDITELHGQLFGEIGGFAEDADAFSSLVSNLQRQVTTARMVSLDTLFTRLRLLVLDGAEREQKEVRTEIRGEQVTLDKTILDQIYTPLLHLVRNAVTHGIEAPDRRAQLKKPRVGTVSIGARQEAGRIIIEVTDDGGGLDLEGLKRRGVARGLVPDDIALDDPLVADLVFAKGVSTRQKATSAAGRGIGGDAIRSVVNKMNGQVYVQTTQGTGTRFVITLPLTLAITRALVVRMHGQVYAIPLYFTERIVEAGDSKIIESAGIKRLMAEGRSIMIVDPNEIFGGGSEMATGPIVVLHVGDARLALRVDAVIRQEEIFVRSLGGLLGGHPLFAGVMVSGSGEPQLIIDTQGVMAAAGILRTSELTTGAPIERVRQPFDQPPPQEQEQKLKVLFIDDSLSVRKVAEKFLTGLGVDVTLGIDGVDGLEKLRGGSFDIVFTDLEMPRLHGYDLIRELRSLPAYRETPIVVVTSRSGQKHRDHARAVGANEYVTKPFTVERFAEILGKWRTGAVERRASK